MKITSKTVTILKWIVLILLYIFDFALIRVLEITFASIAFILDWVIFSGIMFGIRKMFNYLRNKMKSMEKKLSEK